MEPRIQYATTTGGAAAPKLTPFTGREDETAVLRSHLENAVRGRGGLVLVAGEPGVGKTRLISELAIHAADRGLQVVSGRAYESEGMPPYLPLVEALSQYLSRREAEQLREELSDAGPYLAKLVPRLSRLLPDIPPTPNLGPEGERYRLFESVCDFLLAAAERTPLLVFLDDLHWADEATLLLLEHLSPRLTEGHLLVVGSYRDLEAAALARLLGELRRQRIGSVLTLQRFDSEDAMELLEAILGKEPAQSVGAAVFATAEGNAFFTEELVWHLLERGLDLTDPDCEMEQIDVPEGVRMVTAGRIARLTSEAKRVLSYSSVLGKELSLGRIAAVTDRPEIDVLDLLEEAVASHVLREAPEGYAFAHPLIRETLYQGLTATRRRHLHGRTAEALEALYGADLQPERMVELAHHFCQAVSRGDDSDKAIEYATRAGERALGQVAYEEAARLFEMALAVLDLGEAPASTERCELLLAIGEAKHWAGDLNKARDAFVGAAGIARGLNAAEQFARAALGFAGTAAPPVTNEVAVALLEESLSMLGETDSPVRVRVLGRLAVEIHDTDSRARREALIAEAIQMSKRLGDPAIKAHALIASLGALVFPDNAHERLIAAREVTQLAESTGDHEGAIFGSHFTLPVLLQMGEMSAYDDELIKLRTLADRIRRPIWRWDALAFSATRATMQGRFEEGEALAREALALGRERRSAQNARGSFETQMIVLRRLQGRARELEVDVKRTLERFPEIAVRRAALASIYCDLGSGLDARREFEHLAVDGFTRILPHTMWLCTMSLLSETCAYLRDRRTAQALYGRLNRYALQNISGGGVAVYGSASRYLGLLVTTMCRWDDAERHFQDALEMNARMEARPWVTHTQYDYANMLLARRGPGDRKKAYALLKEALEAAREMGMKSLEERAQKLLESRKGLVPKYPDGLSRREVDVLRLIAAGGSNSQIAEQLFLSVRTVERHITNAYGKIGAGGRADATAYALSHGLAARESQAAGV